MYSNILRKKMISRWGKYPPARSYAGYLISAVLMIAGFVTPF